MSVTQIINKEQKRVEWERELVADHHQYSQCMRKIYNWHNVQGEKAVEEFKKQGS